MTDLDTMSRDELVTEVRRLRVALGPAGDTRDPDLDLGREDRTEFPGPDGRTLVHNHSAIAMALASYYGGKHGAGERAPFLMLDECTARQAGAEYRELLRTLFAAAEMLNAEVNGTAHYPTMVETLGEVWRVLRKHNRPRPA